MKRMAALVLCVLMLMTAAFAETAETTPETVETTPTTAVVQVNAQSVETALSALGDEDCSAAWEALSGGETIARGTKSDAARGLQLVLKALGYNLYIDGNAGKNTFAALNEQRVALGEAETDTVDAACFARLVLWLYVQDNRDSAETILSDAGLEDGEAEYWLGCLDLADGRGYAAAQHFTACNWSNSAERAEACAQAWPESGEIYRAEELTDRDVQLVLAVKDQPAGEATLVKIYSADECVSIVFIGEDGEASVRLPAGEYSMHVGTGEKWYGESDAFGEDGSYEEMLFGEDSTSVTLETHMKYTLTLNDDTDANVESTGLTPAEF